ncbi:unnamed protein product [Nippostrongylus brasiliensis]|uniref:Nodule Cysteine-Rich (NCR) secreted peptide n=1 Tax=Nippostrongylus brasiliensis TaxID=27835 RepID=A0A0N4YPL3_NIPBR|nr:unnamed protein product [Nippostrongylus brasiliensis]
MKWHDELRSIPGHLVVQLSLFAYHPAGPAVVFPSSVGGANRRKRERSCRSTLEFSMKAFGPLLILVVALVTAANSQYGRLWCHEGGKDLYTPAQCPDQTLECFKFSCESDDRYPQTTSVALHFWDYRAALLSSKNVPLTNFSGTP